MIGGANRWTDFVKKWASDNDTTYGCALSKPECSQAYRAKYGNRKKLSQKKERELMGAEDKDAPAPPEPDYGDDGGDGGDDGPPPPKKKGRPKKYETEAEAKRAKSQKTMEAKKRRQQEKKASKADPKEAEAMGAEDKDAPVRYLAEIKRLAKEGPSARPRVKELSVIFNSGGMNEKEMDAFEALAQQFKKPMAPPSGPPPISAERVAEVKESKASKLQRQRELMSSLREKRKSEGRSATGKTLMVDNTQRMLDLARVAEEAEPEPIRLEVMEIAEPTVSTKMSPNITIAPPRKLKAPKPQKLQAEGVEAFVRRLPEGLEKYTASFLLESDPLKEFDSVAGLYALYYCLELIGPMAESGPRGALGKYEFPEIKKVKYGVRFRKSEGVRFPENLMEGYSNVGLEGPFISKLRERPTFNGEIVIDNIPRVQTAINVLMGKQTDWRVEVYYGGGMGDTKGIRCSIRWTGKKGQRGQDELWKQFWIDTIRPILMVTPRWDRALARVSERREVAVAERAVAREAQIADIARVGAEEVQTDLSVKQVLGAVKKVLDDNKMSLSGYTKWKDQGIPFIIGQMKRIFDKGPQEAGMKVVDGYLTPQFTPDRRPVWEAFKALIAKKTGSGMEGGKFDIFDDLIIPVGTKVGEPYKQTTGLNPFTLGFKLGRDVIAPALMRRFPPRGRGMEGGHWTATEVSHLEKEMRNYQNIAHHLGQHLAESGSQDPKDQIGFYHFSKEAKRVADLIDQIGS